VARWRGGFGRGLRRATLAVGDIGVTVAAQDMKSSGSGSPERRFGVDLYISGGREDGPNPLSKGILVQAKKAGAE